MTAKHGNLRFRLVSAVLLALPLLSALYGALKGHISPLRLVTAAALAPVQSLVRESGQAAEDLIRGRAICARLRAENETLRQRLAMDEYRLQQAELDARENRELRARLDMQARYTDCTLCPARVISAARDYGGTVYTLDRGTTDGVAPGNAVVVHEGLMGRISAAGPDWCEMIPVTHRDFRAAVRLLFSGETGIAAGDGEALGLSYLPEDSAALPGDRALTSGAGGQFPPGLLLGTLEHPVLREDGLSTGSALRLAGEPSADRVYIVTDFVSVE